MHTMRNNTGAVRVIPDVNGVPKSIAPNTSATFALSEGMVRVLKHAMKSGDKLLITEATAEDVSDLNYADAIKPASAEPLPLDDEPEQAEQVVAPDAPPAKAPAPKRERPKHRTSARQSAQRPKLKRHT
jgi:hypothetical protein